MLSKLSSLSIASLRKVDEDANKFYDRKHDLYHTAILTRCYTQYAIRPYIDSEMNHIRHHQNTIHQQGYGSETHLREVPIYVKSRIVTS